MEQVALEIRHLSRTEVGEAAEPFAPGQKGSSAMPHKRNPVIAERLCGLARVLRGYLLAGLEDVALWHERDISHSSVERVAPPDALTLVVYMLRKATTLVSGLVLYPERARENLEVRSLGSRLPASRSCSRSSKRASRATTPDRSSRAPLRRAVEEGRPLRDIVDEEIEFSAEVLERAFSAERALGPPGPLR
jgi:adenylosuccinate lyase